MGSESEGTTKKNSASEREKHRTQKYRPDWEKLHLFKDWLGPGKILFEARCTICDVDMVSEYGVLKIHSSRQKHIKAMSAIPSKTKQRNIMSAFVTKGVVPKNQVVIVTENKLAAFLVEHNIAIQAADHMSDNNGILEDFGVEHRISMKRSKTTAMTATEIIGEREKSSLAEKLTKFSVMSDKSTDVSTQKASCIIVRYDNI
ncbi:unnamed protein product [Pieris macdunnoughi]|uniref:Uncharacterized protein n=1 Tax=Pieris macdunnoughi TaxID=345717 RepID=A0A821UKA1_9NEOP|nr:unnamed protein product [Pieris macdunnoughi]